MNNIAGKTDITDDELKGNERIEEAISSLQKEPSQEMLAPYTYCYKKAYE